MKIIVTHNSPDLDAISSVWLIKRFLPGWDQSITQFVPAGDRMEGSVKIQNSEFRIQNSGENKDNVIEDISGNEIIHVDTGLGSLDHHQTDSDKISAASLTWKFIKIQNSEFRIQNKGNKTEAIDRMVKVITEVDHFKEIFWGDPTADYHEFSIIALLEGSKMIKPDQDNYYIEFGSQCLDAILHNFENRIAAEKEIAENGHKFKTSFGEGIGFETINDAVLKLSQRTGYSVVVRKDPRKGYVRIKARPSSNGKSNIDLTPAYETLKKMDPEASWFLHSSRKMILNGTTKSPKMKPSKLSLDDIISVLKEI